MPDHAGHAGIRKTALAHAMACRHSCTFRCAWRQAGDVDSMHIPAMPCRARCLPATGALGSLVPSPRPAALRREAGRCAAVLAATCMAAGIHNAPGRMPSAPPTRLAAARSQTPRTHGRTAMWRRVRSKRMRRQQRQRCAAN
eukprot:364918-Chlamydomonas_euryale.AAC.1